MSRVEDELGEGEVVWDVGKRVPKKFSHSGREGEREKERVIRS